jgi:uncharacterized protein
MRILSPLLLAASLGLGFPALADVPATLTVSGSSTVAVVPDMATVSLGVTTIADSAAAAMKANSDSVAAVMERLKATGIEDRDIQTSNLSLNPNWVSNSSGTANEIQGYTATNMLTIRVRDLAKTGAVLDAAITDGANTLNGLTFGLQNPRPTEDEARKAAVTDAMARAKLLADAAGVKLGPILSMNEGGMSEPGPQPMYRMDAAAVPVAGGEVDIAASVTVVFQIN